MSKPLPEPEILPPAPPNDNKKETGTSLAVLYGLLAVALALAIGMALLIVRPFYLRR